MMARLQLPEHFKELSGAPCQGHPHDTLIVVVLLQLLLVVNS